MTSPNSGIERAEPPLGARLLRRNGALLAAFVVIAVVVLVVPLPPLVLDALLAASFVVAAGVLVACLRVTEPVRAGTFPVVMLLTTLLRLSLAVAAARLILGRTDANAGVVVGAFGDLLVAGSPLVGGVVFVIILLMHWTVITRGAERVAEVAARFTLDAMPGRQVAIDADLRAGSIHAAEADRRRTALQRESDFFGSMDGAMKFVRGEAALSTLIVLLIFSAGVAVGMTRDQAEFTDAAITYGRLAIGAGLVVLIPALMLAVAAGLLVTRVAGESGSPGQLHGVPSAPVPITLEIGHELADRIAGDGSLEAGLGQLPRRIGHDLGLPLPELESRVMSRDAEPRGYRVLVYDNPVESGRIETDDAPLAAIVVRLEAAIRRHAGELLGIEEVRSLLDARRAELPTLIHEVVGPRLSLAQLTEVLRRLVAEDVPIRDLRLILGTLATDAGTDASVESWTERVRQAMRRTLSHRFAAGDNRLDVFLVDEEIRRPLRGAAEPAASGLVIGVDPELSAEILAAAQRCARVLPDGLRRPVFLADPDVRPLLRTLLHKGLIKITGRAEVLGRPLLYGTTRRFLEHFGLKSLNELPKVEELPKP